MKRRAGLDTTRGYFLMNSMLAAVLPAALAALPASFFRDLLISQYSHSPWRGFTYADVGFPGYLILMAVSLCYSFSKLPTDRASKDRFFWKTTKRAAALAVFGFFFEGGFSRPFGSLLFVGIFYKLSLCLFFMGIMQRWLSTKGHIAALLLFFAAHWALLALIDVPGFGSGKYTRAGNAEDFLKAKTLEFLNLRLGLGPVGRSYAAQFWWYLNAPKMFGSCLIGLILGRLLLTPADPRTQARWLAAISAGLVVWAFAWSFLLPINKHLWTPTFTVVSAGISIFVLTVFIQLVEVWECRRLAYFFSVFGRHPLLSWAIFFGGIPLNAYAKFFIGDAFAPWLGYWHPLAIAIVQVMLCWCLIAWYQRLSDNAKLGRSMLDRDQASGTRAR